MSANPRENEACGAHPLGDAIPGSYFNYTCDDCMLPYMIVRDDYPDNEEGLQEVEKPSEDIPF